MTNNYDQELIKEYLKQVSNIKMLSAEEEKELSIRAKQGDRKALESLIKANLRFVINVAKKYSIYDVPFIDLISAGNLGLIEAALRYDPDKNVKFISYAVWWIKQAIISTISQQLWAVKIPSKRTSIAGAVTLAYNTLLRELEREPTYQEIADFINRHRAEKKNKKEHKQNDKEGMKDHTSNNQEHYITEEDIKIYIEVCRVAVSLDVPITEDSDDSFADILPIEENETIEDKIINDQIITDLYELLNQLSDRERQILELRYGLKNTEPYTLEKASKELGISKERVRQLETKAIKKLRSILKKKYFG